MALRSILITGASRGIGFGLTKHLLEFNPTIRVIATCRDPSTATQLTELSALYNKERLLVLQLDTTSADSYTAAVAELTAQDITSLDCVVANAGIGSRHNTLNCPASDALEVYNTNVVGSMLTAQAFHGLLTAGNQKSPGAAGAAGTALMVFISSVMGSIEKTKNTGGGAMAYRASKAALNMLAVSYAEELEQAEAAAEAGVKVKVKVLAVHPGWVQTDMGNSGGRIAPVTVKDSVAGIAQLLASAASAMSVLPGNHESEVTMTTTATITSTPSAYTSYVEKLQRENCVFVAYNGELLPW